MIDDRKYEYRYVSPAAPEPPAPEPLRTYKPRRATQGGAEAAVERGRSAVARSKVRHPKGQVPDSRKAPGAPPTSVRLRALLAQMGLRQPKVARKRHDRIKVRFGKTPPLC